MKFLKELLLEAHVVKYKSEEEVLQLLSNHKIVSVRYGYGILHSLVILTDIPINITKEQTERLFNFTDLNEEDRRRLIKTMHFFNKKQWDGQKQFLVRRHNKQKNLVTYATYSMTFLEWIDEVRHSNSDSDFE